MNTATEPANESGARFVTSKSGARGSHLAIFWFLLWPLLSVLVGAYYTKGGPTTQAVPLWMAFTGILVGTLYLIPEFLVSAAILFAFSWVIFRLFPPAEPQPVRRRLFEPAIAFLGVSLGISLEFPAILSNSIFTPVHPLPLFAGWILIASFLIILAGLRNGLHARNVATVILPVMAFVAFGWGITQLPVAGQGKESNRNSTVILGVDSMGLKTDIRILRTFAKENGGAFYEKAVTPGLLTNAVWTAILQHRPIHDTAVMLTFQSPDWSRSPFQLVNEAKQRGYQTWSFFTGQNTIYVGSMGEFDHDRSGPMGWLDVATVGAKNGSIFVPFITSRLPHIPFSHIRRNQAGTYAYDLRAVVHNVLSSHDGARPVFTVAHLGYIHDSAYPRMADLSQLDRHLLLVAQVDSLKDAGADWRVLGVEGDVIDLRSWKYQNVQRVITDEIRRTGFLIPEKRNRLVLLSDHGIRSHLDRDNFNEEQYYRVPLITFGLPVRDVTAPISLLDVPELVGIADATQPHPVPPVVEYTNLENAGEFVDEVRAAQWTADGRIDLRATVGQKYLGLLKSYDPYKEDSDPTNDDRKSIPTRDERNVAAGANPGHLQRATSRVQ